MSAPRTIGEEVLWGPAANAADARTLHMRIVALRSSMGDSEALAHLREQGVSDRVRQRWERWGRFCAEVDGIIGALGHLPLRQALKLTKMNEEERFRLALAMDRFDSEHAETVIRAAKAGTGIQKHEELWPEGIVPKKAVVQKTAPAPVSTLPALPSGLDDGDDSDPFADDFANAAPGPPRMQLHLEPEEHTAEFQRAAAHVQLDLNGFRFFCHNDRVHQELRKLAEADIIEGAIVEAHQQQLWVLWRQRNVLESISITNRQINELPALRV